MAHQQMKKNRHGKYSLVSVFIALVIFSLACSGVGEPSATPTAEPTITATQEPTATDTPMPTDTPEPTSTPDLKATRAAEATDAAGIVMGQIEGILTKAGATTGEGFLVYAEVDENSIEADGHNATRYQNLDIDREVADFAFHSNITWTSELGFSGCGLMFRIEGGDIDRGKYYDFYYNRLSGAPYYLINSYDSGSWMRRVGDGYSGLIDEDNGATNELLLIAKKGEFQVFFNGKRANVFYDSSIAKGEFAIEVWTNSGRAECVYEDTWIWSWDKQ